MRLVSVSQPPSAPATAEKRLYFVHIPKTAGVTVKAFLENHFKADDAFVMDEWKTGDLPSGALDGFRLFSGHYSSQVFKALSPRPDTVITLVREPVARFRSWTAHGRRSSYSKYRETCTQGTDLEIANAFDSYAGRQAHWLRRALHEDREWKGIPAVDEIPSLLDQIDLAGMVEEIERFMQLVAFRMDWPAPDLRWHLNRRPDSQNEGTAERAREDAALREALAVDVALYAQVQTRFWKQYADMLTAINPGAETYTAQTAQTSPVELVQVWLGQWHQAQLLRRDTMPADRLVIDSNDALEGEGWWWREQPGVDSAYRWSGPGSCATLRGPSLVEDRHYRLVIAVVGAADWTTWDQVSVAINGQPVRVVHERRNALDNNFNLCRLYADLDPTVIARQRGVTEIGITVPEPKASMAHLVREESNDTFNKDTRKVGVAVRQVLIEPVTAPVKPTLSLRRPSVA